MSDSRCSYYRMKARCGSTLLVRDDGYRIHVLQEKNPRREAAGMPVQEGTDEWTFMMEYKHCDFPGMAFDVIRQMLKGLKRVDPATLNPKFLEY